METDWSVAWFLFILHAFAGTNWRSAMNYTWTKTNHWNLKRNYPIQDLFSVFKGTSAVLWKHLITAAATSPWFSFWLGVCTWIRNLVQSPPGCLSYRLRWHLLSLYCIDFYMNLVSLTKLSKCGGSDCGPWFACLSWSPCSAWWNDCGGTMESKSNKTGRQVNVLRVVCFKGWRRQQADLRSS